MCSLRILYPTRLSFGRELTQEGKNQKNIKNIPKGKYWKVFLNRRMQEAIGKELTTENPLKKPVYRLKRKKSEFW